MTETLIRDVLAEKKRARISRLVDRIARNEKGLAVLLTRFNLNLEVQLSEQDLKKLRKEMEEHVSSTINHVCDHFDKQLEQHAKDSLVANKRMMRVVIKRHAVEQAKTRRRILYYGLVTLSVVMMLTGRDGAAAMLRWATSLFGV